MLWSIVLLVLSHPASSNPLNETVNLPVDKIPHSLKLKPSLKKELGRDARAAVPKSEPAANEKGYVTHKSLTKAFDDFMVEHPTFCPNLTQVYNHKALQDLLEKKLRHCAIMEFLFKVDGNPAEGIDPSRMDSKMMHDGPSILYKHIKLVHSLALQTCTGSGHWILNIMYPGLVSIGLYCLIRLAVWLTTPWRRWGSASPI